MKRRRRTSYFTAQRVPFPHSRTGFTLIEVLVSVTMLSIILVSVAKTGAVLALRGRSSDVVAKRDAVLQLETDKLDAAPFSTLATWPTGSKTITEGDFTYTRRLTITSQSALRYTVKIVVVPSADSTKTDSVIFDRTNPPSASPLCVGC